MAGVAPGAGAEAKFGAEGVVEVGDITEAGVEGNIEHARGIEQEARGGAAQPGAENVLVRRKTNQLAEHAEEMIAAEFRFAGEGAEFVLRFGMIINHAGDARHARFRGRNARAAWFATARERKGLPGKLDGDFFPVPADRALRVIWRGAMGLSQAGAGSRDERRQFAHGRDAQGGETRIPAANTVFGGEGLEIARLVGKGNASVPYAVIVPALEVLPGISKKERSGGHQLAAGARAVLKAASGDDGDADIGMLLFKGTVVRAGSAHDAGHAPAVARRKQMPRGEPCRGTSDRRRRGGLKIDRNFRQEDLLPETIQQPERCRKAASRQVRPGF